MKFRALSGRGCRLVLICLSGLGATLAAPARIIILRHGEKADKCKLGGVGQQRADALAATYLGRGAAKSLFSPGKEPAAFLAITLHTLELASPAVAASVMETPFSRNLLNVGIWHFSELGGTADRPACGAKAEIANHGSPIDIL